MSMRLDLEFRRPLQPADRQKFLVAVALIAKTRRVYIDRTLLGAVIFAESLGKKRLMDALAEEGIEVTIVETSLDEAEDALCEQQMLAVPKKSANT